MIILLVKGDPKGYEEKATLEREVNCLESYLEALPALLVLAYLKKAYPAFLDTLGLFSFYRPFYQTCFTMTLFLKSGPCFILPRKGLFGGIFTWRFIAMFVLNQLSFKLKFFEAQFDGETYLANVVCVSTLGGGPGSRFDSPSCRQLGGRVQPRSQVPAPPLSPYLWICHFWSYSQR